MVEDSREPTGPGSGSAIALMLAEIYRELAKRPDEARTRALRAKADGYSRVLERWDLLAPTEAQRAALTDLVETLCDDVEEAPPSSSHPIARVVLKSKPPDE